jgi:hypothetical protein
MIMTSLWGSTADRLGRNCAKLAHTEPCVIVQIESRRALEQAMGLPARGADALAQSFAPSTLGSDA